MAGAIVVGTDPLHRPTGDGADATAAHDAQVGTSVFRRRGIAVAAIMINIFASVDFHQSGSWVFVELINRMLYLCALLIGSLVVALRSLEKSAGGRAGGPVGVVWNPGRRGHFSDS